MRNDANIDRKQVKLKNSSLLGYGKWKAQTGDFIQYNQNHSRPDDPADIKVGRVIARIAYAPALQGDPSSIRNWIVAAVFSDDLTFVYERWVNPESVSRCWKPQDKQRKLWDFMNGADFPKHSPDELREWCASGFANWEDFAEWKRNR